MATKTAAQLKAFFQTGDQPSQDEFAHLIDTIQPDPVFIDGTADVNLTVADHAFRHVIIAGDIDNNTADRTYTLPTPALGTWFHIVYIADLDAADSHDFQLSNQSSCFFQGQVITKDIGEANANDAVLSFNGTNANGLSLDTGASADLWVVGKSTTVNYIWGNTAGADVATVLT